MVERTKHGLNAVSKNERARTSGGCRNVVELVYDVIPNWELFGIIRRCRKAQSIIDDYNRFKHQLNHDWLACVACEVVHERDSDRCGIRGFTSSPSVQTIQECRYLTFAYLNPENLKAFDLACERPDFWELKTSALYSGIPHLFVTQRDNLFRPVNHLDSFDIMDMK